MRHNNSRLLSVSLSILLCFFPVLSNASNNGSAKKILKDATQAHGGEKALSCKSITIDFDVAFVDPVRFEGTGRIVAKPDRFRLDYDLNPNLIYRYGYDGAQAWVSTQSDLKSAKYLDRVQVSLFKLYSMIFSTRWLQYLQEHRANLKHAGQETYAGVPTEILQVNVEVIGNIDFLIDAKSFLLKAIRFNFPGEWQPHYEIVYGSYAEHNGVKTPMKIDLIRDKKHYRDYKVKEVRLCEEITDNVFSHAL